MAHCALDLAKDHAPYKCPLLLLLIFSNSIYKELPLTLPQSESDPFPYLYLN